VGALRCGEMCRLLDVNNAIHLKCLTDMIDTLVLDHSFASGVFLDHIIERMDSSQPLHNRFSSMTQLIIFKADHQSSHHLGPLLRPINFCNHPLQRVHLVFERPTVQYWTILSTFVSNRLSFPTMIFEVEKGR
jgi:hypothetical protein